MADAPLPNLSNHLAHFLKVISIEILRKEIKHMIGILITNEQSSAVQVALRYVKFRNSAIVFRTQFRSVSESVIMPESQKKKIFHKLAVCIAHSRNDFCNHIIKRSNYQKNKRFLNHMSIAHSQKPNLYINKLESLNIFQYVPNEHVNLICNINKDAIKTHCNKVKKTWLKFFLAILKLIPDDDDHRYNVFAAVTKIIRKRSFEKIYLKNLLYNNKWKM